MRLVFPVEELEDALLDLYWNDTLDVSLNDLPPPPTIETFNDSIDELREGKSTSALSTLIDTLMPNSAIKDATNVRIQNGNYTIDLGD